MKPTFIYFYDEQIKRYILQTMAIFASLYVQHDDGEFQQLNVRFADGDRVAESAFNNHNQNAIMQLPIAKCKLRDFSQNLSRAKGTNTIRTSIIAPPGTLPSEAVTTYQVQPKPYDFSFELTVLTSNLNQMFQITEQICAIFDPIITIQSSNSHIDPTCINTLKLDSIITDSVNEETNEKTKHQKTFTFLLEGYIYSPVEFKQNLIKQIQTNINLVNTINVNFNFDDLTINDLIASVTISDEKCG
ncbi:MAG: tail sheath stabilizer and completion protein [Candidatus Riesia sp.]|nr:tail sheath stabilizer and completion protein [Candidatus Riesia sp.]